MIGALHGSHLEWTRNTHHVPSAFGRVAVRVTAANFSRGNLSAGQSRLSKVFGESDLLHGFAYVGFANRLVLSARGADERLFIQPCHRVIEIAQVIGFLGVFFREQGIDLFVQSF